MLVLLVANSDPAAEVGPAVVEQLARLGVTDLSVLRDEQTTAISLAGWAFEPARSADEAAHAVTAEGGAVQVLRPVLESAIHRLPRPGAQAAAGRAPAIPDTNVTTPRGGDRP